MVDGQNSLLTNAHRKYLQDRSGYSRQAQYDKREEIKGRVRWGVRDFTLLVNELPDEERRDIFGFSDEGDLPDERDIQQGIKDALRFFYLGLEVDHPFGVFKPLVESAVWLAEQELPGQRSVNPTFELNPGEGYAIDSDVIEKIEEGRVGELTVPEALGFIHHYSQTPAFDPADALEHARHDRGTSKHPPGEYDPEYSTDDGGE